LTTLSDPAYPTPPALVLQVRDLRVAAPGAEILHGVSLALKPSEMHGIVGETGSGKSMTARATMGLLPIGVTVTGGSIRLGDRELVGLPEPELRQLRGSVLANVFQNPRTALNPMATVGRQMRTVARAHLDLSRREADARVLEGLALVAVPDPERIVAAHPHELSGGLAQRVVIATALLGDPEILIADEPTTGLDATVQRQILDLLADLQRRLSLSIMMITHDLAIVAQYCATVDVMHAGLVVESGTVVDVLSRPRAAYTQALLQASRLELDDRAEQTA
jgi:ABC-type glutathione transport system ATPase component